MGQRVWKPSSRPPWPGSTRRAFAGSRRPGRPVRNGPPSPERRARPGEPARASAPARSSACAARASSSTWEERAREFSPSISSRATCPQPGSSIEVVVERFDPEEGVQLLRRKGSAIDADWETLRKGVIVEARVTKAVKGGLEVDVDGIRGFLPISQIDLSRVEDAASYINQKFKAIVTEANQREKNLVVSRRELLEQERAELRERTWATLEEGQVHEGVVRSIKGFGAFVDIGGVDGLLPIGEMSWSRIAKVDDLVKTGDKVKVKVLKIDRTTRKLTLGSQAAHAQPLGDRRRTSIPAARWSRERSPGSWSSARSSSSSRASRG